MIVEELKKSILENAIRGKLTVQKSNEHATNFLNKLIEGKKEYISNNKLQDNMKKEKIKEYPFELPNNWIWTTIGDICYVTKLAGFEYTKYMVSNVSTSGDVPIVRAKNIKPASFIDTIEEYISLELSEKLYRCALNEKCVLMTFIGAGIGEVAIFDKNERHHLAPNVAKIVPPIDINKYIMYYLMSPAGLREVFKYKKQTAQPSLSMETIRKVAIPLPPLEEQQRIVDKIEELFAKLDEIRPIEEELDKLKKVFSNDIKKSIIKSIMCGNLNLNNLNEKNNLITDSEIKTDNLPINWRRVKAKEILNVITGKKDANYGKSDGQYLFYTCANIPIKSPTYSFEGKNLILPGNGANVGLTIYSEEKFEAYQRTYVVNSKYDENVINLKFIYYYFVGFWNDYNKNKMYGSAIPYIKLGNLQDFEINIPPIEEQQRIVDKLEQLLPLCDNIEKIINAKEK